MEIDASEIRYDELFDALQPQASVRELRIRVGRGELPRDSGEQRCWFSLNDVAVIRPARGGVLVMREQNVAIHRPGRSHANNSAGLAEKAGLLVEFGGGVHHEELEQRNARAIGRAAQLLDQVR